MARSAWAGFGLLLLWAAATPAPGQDAPGPLTRPAPARACAPSPAPRVPLWVPAPPSGEGELTPEQRLWLVAAQTAELTRRVEALTRQSDALARALQQRRRWEAERAEAEMLRRYKMKARGPYYPSGD